MIRAWLVTTAANAEVTAVGWCSCGVRRICWIRADLPATSLRLARVNTAAICARDSRAARCGSGALASSSSASGAASVVEGLQERRTVLPQRRAHPQHMPLPIQTNDWCARATSLTASACGLSPTTGR